VSPVAFLIKVELRGWIRESAGESSQVAHGLLNAAKLKASKTDKMKMAFIRINYFDKFYDYKKMNEEKIYR